MSQNIEPTKSKKIMLEIDGITKEYPGVKALDNVSLKIECGEVHGLVGKNGAGKSTLIKILSGVIQDYKGKIYINGKEADLSSPGYSFGKGISTVYQEFSLVPTLSVAENIYLGRFPYKENFGLNIIDRVKLYEDVEYQFSRLGVDISPNIKVNNLSVSQKQLVEIAKAISVNPNILLLDEPTSALSKEEAEHLFNIINRLSNSGVSIIYVSHILEEVEKVSNKVTVLRNGKKVDTLNIKKCSAEKMVNMMVGKDVVIENRQKSFATEETVLKVKNLSKKDVLKNINFELKKGEILGFGGLMGSGRTELVRCIFGLDSFDDGYIELDGNKLEKLNPHVMKKNKIGFSPEDRKKQGLIPLMSVKNNVSISILNKLTMSGTGKIKKNQEKKLVKKIIDKFQIKTSGLNNVITSLSGGNQQKVVIGRWIAINPKVLLLDEPTQGIDIGAKVQIYNIMDELVQEGVSIIFISSEIEELVKICDRILIMREGSIINELKEEKINLKDVVSSAMGVSGNNE